MAVWSELWNSILQARLDQMGWNLKWFIFELFLTEIVNDFLIKTANFKMWFYAVSKMLHLTLTLCLSLASQQMAFFPICILPCLCAVPHGSRQFSKNTIKTCTVLYFMTSSKVSSWNPPSLAEEHTVSFSILWLRTPIVTTKHFTLSLSSGTTLKAFGWKKRSENVPTTK